MQSERPIQMWPSVGMMRLLVVISWVPILIPLVVIRIYGSGLAWPVYPIVAALALAFNVSMVRRRCVLTETALIAQGRFVRRVIPLTELKQVAINVTDNVYVQTRTPMFNRGDICVLRMIVVGTLSAVKVIREQATAAGATLDPLPAARGRIGSRKL